MTKQEHLEAERLEILMGGVEYEVLIPPTKEGADITRELIKVRKLPLKDLSKLQPAMTNPLTEASIYTGKKVEEVEQWDVDSVLGVVMEGRRLNEKSFSAWFELMVGTAKMAGIDLREQVNQAVKTAVQDSQKSSSS